MEGRIWPKSQRWENRNPGGEGGFGYLPSFPIPRVFSLVPLVPQALIPPSSSSTDLSLSLTPSHPLFPLPKCHGQSRWPFLYNILNLLALRSAVRLQVVPPWRWPRRGGKKRMGKKKSKSAWISSRGWLPNKGIWWLHECICFPSLLESITMNLVAQNHFSLFSYGYRSMRPVSLA